ncbi:PAAR domain-containing protein [Stenotrophomonas sp. LGBM10]|uniref:PAAR domain-containing protein n=1 Tax=Stenotrophomonas sp. LGBM10 TaxID=3390038 RepID=UPI00398AF92B
MLIVVGDTTTSGGRVITGSPFTDIEGKPVARINDYATCPVHGGAFAIVSGDATLIIDGQPVAREGDRLACGCSLIAGQQHLVYVDDGPAVPAAATAAAKAPASTAPAKQTVPICESCLQQAGERGTVYLARAA